MLGNHFHHYQKDRSKNYNYIDRVVKSYIEHGGALFHIHKLIATIDSNGNENPIDDGLSIGDSVLNENPYRKYSKEVYDLWGVTRMNTPKFSFNFDGLSILDGDEKEITVHYNSMVAQLNRKIIVGDVVEISWLRDLDILGSEKAQNKFYQVTSSERDENSWDATYRFHLWKIKIKPITDSSEYKDLFNYNEENTFYEEQGSINGGGGMNPENTTNYMDLILNDKILEEAEEKGPSHRLHDEHHVYLDLVSTLYDKNGRFIPDGIDGIAKELNCEDIPYGDSFPNSKEVSIGSYFLRIDYMPCRLFRREFNEETNNGYWKLIEMDSREEWTGASWNLRRAVNTEGTFETESGRIVNKQENIKDLVKARVKKEHNNKKDWKKITNVQIDRSAPTGI